MCGGIQADPALQTREVVAELVRHPGVRRLVHRQRKDQRDHKQYELSDGVAVDCAHPRSDFTGNQEVGSH